MSKRRLTSQQLERQRRIQALRLERAKQQASSHFSDSLGPEQSGLLIAHYGTTLVVESQDGHHYRCTSRQNLGSLVTGDEIIWQAIDEKTGVITACQPRRSVIMRPNSHQIKPIVANVDLMLIVIAKTPAPQPTTLDRYLILAKVFNVPPIIVLNKCDLSQPTFEQDWEAKLNVYRQLGYPLIKISSKTRLGINELLPYLEKGSAILVGQSGVGKSSLLNAIVPDANVQIGALSRLRGKHTTTTSTLYHLPGGGHLIDSPGIHQFSLNHFTAEQILSGYQEFFSYLDECKFRDCDHHTAPECALKAAIQNGSIAPFRLANYHAILASNNAK